MSLSSVLCWFNQSWADRQNRMQLFCYVFIENIFFSILQKYVLIQNIFFGIPKKYGFPSDIYIYKKNKNIVCKI